MSPQSQEFFTNLYIHNIVTASRESQKENYFESEDSMVYINTGLKKPIENQNMQSQNFQGTKWMTAADALQSKKHTGLD